MKTKQLRAAFAVPAILCLTSVAQAGLLGGGAGGGLAGGMGGGFGGNTMGGFGSLGGNAAGSANGTVHKIRHEGVEHLHGRGRGDLYVHLVVDVPDELDDTSADLLRQLAEHRGEKVSEHSGGLFSRKRAKR